MNMQTVSTPLEASSATVALAMREMEHTVQVSQEHDFMNQSIAATIRYEGNGTHCVCTGKVRINKPAVSSRAGLTSDLSCSIPIYLSTYLFLVYNGSFT